MLNEFIKPVRCFQLSFPLPLVHTHMIKCLDAGDSRESDCCEYLKKFCWCCNQLGSLLGDVKLLGSNGVLYSWTPSRTGIDITILQALENSLWDKLWMAISNITVSLVPSRRSSGSSTNFEFDEIFESDEK